MKKFIFALSFLISSFSLIAQDEWTTIGTHQIQAKSKKGSLTIEEHETPYTELKVTVQGRDVSIGKVWVEFENGDFHIVKVQQEVTPSYPITLDLTGNDQKIYSIALNYERIDVSAVDTSIIILAK